MSVNKYLPHVVIIPEDDANRQISIGFALKCVSKQLKTENSAGGWRRAVDYFLDEYAATMRMFTGRFVVLLIDCDGNPKRIADIRGMLPDDIANRVFVLGCLDEPERLRSAGLGTFEEIGMRIADDCREGVMGHWDHDFLRHNLAELNNLRDLACGILWQSHVF